MWTTPPRQPRSGGFVGWARYAGRGTPPREDANGYLAHVFGELGRTLAGFDGTLGELARKHETPGGINEQFRTAVRDPERVRKSLNDVLARVKGQ